MCVQRYTDKRTVYQCISSYTYPRNLKTDLIDEN